MEKLGEFISRSRRLNSVDTLLAINIRQGLSNRSLRGEREIFVSSLFPLSSG